MANINSSHGNFYPEEELQLLRDMHWKLRARENSYEESLFILMWHDIPFRWLLIPHHEQ